jgi:cation diffusion facilitator family transporter
MITLLSKIFIKDRENTKDTAVRHAYGMLMSVVGIVVNLLLAVLKLIFGIISGSIAVTADAVNNMSDAGSQVISMISFKIAAKPADRDHPFGHARIEYVASMIVSFFVLLVGYELAKESVNKIINPVPADFSTGVLVVLAVSVLTKIWLGISGKRIAKRINSPVISATASDSLSDAVATSAVLISAIVGKLTGVHTDAYMGVAVSVIIIVAGIKILNDTKNSILGSPPEPEVVEGIVRITEECDQVLGIHDMVVHNYGAGNTIASLHAEVDGSADVYVIHDAIDNIERRLYSEMGVRATIHMDPIVTNDEKVLELKALVTEAVKRVDSRLSIHDFRFVEGITHSNLIFDITAPFEVKLSDREVIDAVDANVKEIDKSFCTVITVDRQ